MENKKIEYPADSHRVVMANEDLASTDLFLEEAKAIATRESSRVRAFKKGMESDWLSIQDASDHYNHFPEEKFEEEFGSDAEDLGRRMFFIESARGELIGTASAWMPHGDWDTEYGRVHWVAVVPEHQGKGLSKVLLSHTLTAMLELGYSKSYLTTGSVRIPAIRLYEKYGFSVVDDVSF